MDRYTRVEKPKPESTINENEIRVTTQGLIRNYISYATSLLQDKRAKEIVLKAMGQAISKTVAIAEIIKDISISSVSIIDVWEPIEEGLVPYVLFGDNSPSINDINHLVNQRAEHEFPRVLFTVFLVQFLIWSGEGRKREIYVDVLVVISTVCSMKKTKYAQVTLAFLATRMS
ncbi:hypothetical protein Ancab_022034 [Ancistrocladus abbreviatus]